MKAFLQNYIALIIILIPINGLLAQTNKTNDIQSHWIESLNEEGNLEEFYNSASGILQQNRLITGIQNINKKWLEFHQMEGSITEYESIETVQLRESSKFELGEYSTKKGSKYYTIIGWRNKNGWFKEIEVTYAAINPRPDSEGDIKFLRDSWQDLANDHRPDLIGKELYIDGGYYFNRGRVYSNNEIADVYSYMNPETFNITLAGLSTTIVNDKVAFDIGSFQTSGKGLYILIWIKTETVWKLLLDFNF